MEYMSRFVDIRLYKAESSAECGKEGAEFDLFHGYVQRISSSWVRTAYLGLISHFVVCSIGLILEMILTPQEENEEQVWSKLFPAIELKEATVSAAKHGKMLGRCYRCRRSYCARVQNSLNSIMVLDTSGCGNSSPCKDSAQSCRGRLLYLLRILKSDFDALQSTAIVTYQTEVSTVIQMLRRYLTEEEYTSAFRDLVDKSFAEMEDAGARAFHVEPPVEPRQGGQECVPCISKF